MGEEQATQAYYANYLSPAHINHPEMGCPVAALAMDVARSSDTVKAAFTNGFNRTIEKLASGEGADQDRADAMRRIATLAGAVMIARAVDKKTAEQIMSACKSF